MENRQRQVQARADLMAASQQRESRQAQALIDAFVVQAVTGELAPIQLEARTLNGRRVRTKLHGWYLRNDHSAAVGTDGRYYHLTIMSGRIVTPTDPPLVLGRGAKDGEAIDLKDALSRALAGEVA